MNRSRTPSRAARHVDLLAVANNGDAMHRCGLPLGIEQDMKA